MLTRMLDLTPDEMLTTTRAVRKRLDLARPVEPEVVRECIEIAVQAPSGSNSQGWHWVVVTDADLRGQIADYYGRNFDRYIDMPRREYKSGDSRAERNELVRSSAIHL